MGAASAIFNVAKIAMLEAPDNYRLPARATDLASTANYNEIWLTNLPNITLAGHTPR